MLIILPFLNVIFKISKISYGEERNRGRVEPRQTRKEGNLRKWKVMPGQEL